MSDRQEKERRRQARQQAAAQAAAAVRRRRTRRVADRRDELKVVGQWLGTRAQLRRTVRLPVCELRPTR